jgi:methanogenic corrinoid protein MtbC1
MSPDGDNPVEELISALVSMDRLVIRELIEKNGKSMGKDRVIDALIVPALEEIGERWEKGTLAISQVYMAGIIIEEIIMTLFPEPDSSLSNEERIATVVLEDFHMLGERIVTAHLIGAGYSPIRYGRRTSSELVPLIKRDNIRYLLVSTLMLPSALKIKEITSQLAGEGVTVIVGGAPFRFDPELGKEVGADWVCHTASDAIAVIRKMEGLS